MADYSDAERDAVRDWIAGAQKSGVRGGAIDREFTFMHELKVQLDARIVTGSDARDQDEFFVPPPDSPFQIPDEVLVQLMFDGPTRDPA